VKSFGGELEIIKIRRMLTIAFEALDKGMEIEI